MKVICIDDKQFGPTEYIKCSGITKGNIYKLYNYDNYDRYVTIIDDYGIPTKMFSSRFEDLDLYRKRKINKILGNI